MTADLLRKLTEFGVIRSSEIKGECRYEDINRQENLREMKALKRGLRK